MLGTAIAEIANSHQWNNEVRALCDDGAQVNLITYKTIIRLGLSIIPINLKMKGAQDAKMKHSLGKAKIGTKSKLDEEVFIAVFYIVEKIMRNTPSTELDQNQSEFNGLILADPNYGKPAEVDALFGLPIMIRITLPGIIKTKDETSMAQASKLGYIIYLTKPFDDTMALINTISTSNKQIVTNEYLSRLMEKFWIVEDVPMFKELTPEEQQCEEIFQSTHYRQPDGRYVVRMPLKENISLLGRSKSIALKQLFAMERKMDQRPDFAADYMNYMRTFEQNGYMSQINETEEDGYYTPHHGVYGASKDKIRIVYNSSSPTSTGISLNECQLTGPRLQDDLAIILMRLRTHRIGIAADIKQMYCQVAIHPDHRKFQKFLFRFDREKPVQVYQLDRVAFGQTAAPYLAIRAMQQCAEDHKEDYPIGAKEIDKSFYVDDMLSGDHDVPSTITKVKEITNILEKGKFELAKWCSNSSEVNEFVHGDHTVIELNDPNMKSVLGLHWDPKTDELTFKVRQNENTGILTKRKILSSVGKLYDPNGYISPVVITAKILIQKLWKLATDWDQAVPPNIEEEWRDFQSNINHDAHSN